MPLPFSFSTQRQSSEVARPAEPIAVAIAEKLMSFAPGFVSTEPMPVGTGSPFALPEQGGMAWAAQRHPNASPANVATAPYAMGEEARRSAELLATKAVAAPAPLQPATPAGALAHDLPAQIEQLRNDIFGIAMNTSALNDRLDRMEQRLPLAGQPAQASLVALRGEIEAWLENHLNAAVEHCMQQILSRTQSAPNRSVN